jgi:hypothetical protein
MAAVKSTTRITLLAHNYDRITTRAAPHSTFTLIDQVPPLTPSSNKKVGEVLKTTYATWDKDSERLGVPRDPRSWSKDHVKHWLTWAVREFSLAGPDFAHFVQQFQVRQYKFE